MSRSNQQPINREPVTDRKMLMPFGKYVGQSIADILDCDSNYLVWLHNNTQFELGHQLLDEAEMQGKPRHAFSEWTERADPQGIQDRLSRK